MIQVPFHVGVVGTASGATVWQAVKLVNALGIMRDRGARVVHHGDRIGVGRLAHWIAWKLNFHAAVHPPNNDDKRAFCVGHTNFSPQGRVAAGYDIVRQCDILVALPRTDVEEKGSLTWSTIRYARKKKRWVVFIDPNGNVCQENWLIEEGQDGRTDVERVDYAVL